MDDEGAFGSESGERAAHQKNATGSKHADDLSARAGWVGQGTAEIENGAEAQSAAQWPQSFHGRMVERREEEDEAGLAKALDGQLRAQSDGHTERLEHVGRAAERGNGAIAVLGDFGSGCGGHQSRASRRY